VFTDDFREEGLPVSDPSSDECINRKLARQAPKGFSEPEDEIASEDPLAAA